METVLICKGAGDLSLGVKLAKPTTTAGSPCDVTREVWEKADSRVRAGIWECTPGVFRTSREGADEIVYILSGSGVLVSDEGHASSHSAGDVVVIPDGFSGEWHIEETLRKVYVSVSV